MDSYAFRQALERSTGAPVVSPTAAAAADHVRSLAQPISALYAQLDTGRLSLDGFRAALSDLGVRETAEAVRLLSQGAPSFTALFRALQQQPQGGAPGAAATATGGAPASAPAVPPSPRPFGPLGISPRASASSSVGSARPALGPRPGERQLDPVSWQGDAAVVGPRHADRRAVVSPFNTALVGNILAAAPGGGGYRAKGREVTAHLRAETGCGAVLRNEPGALPPGVEHGLYAQGAAWRADPRLNRMGAGPRALEELEGRGAAALMAPLPASAPAGGPAQPQEHRFQSHSQAAQARGLVAGDEAPPATSAGYAHTGASAGGPPSARERVHGLIRELDAGRVSAPEFRAQLAALGAAPLPPVMERMLADAARFGTQLDFGKAVRSFEDFFAAAAQQAAAAAAAQQQPQTARAPHAAAARGSGGGWLPGDASRLPPGGGSGGGGVTREQLLLRGGERGLAEPVVPEGYVASHDQRTFTHGHSIGGKYYSPHIPASYKSHGDIVAWQGESTAPSSEEHTQRLKSMGLAGNPNKAPSGTQRGLYDTNAPSHDIMSVPQRRAWEQALSPSGRAGNGTALDVPRPRHLAPQRHASAGPIHAFAGGAFDPADALAEQQAFRRPHLARVDTGLAAYDRAAGNTPWAERE